MNEDKNEFNSLMTMLSTYSARPSWEEYFILMCKLVSLRSSCERLKVGCVLVKNNVVISTGYNGFPAGAPHIGMVRDGHEQLTVHAEMNAIANASKRGAKTNGATCYITHYPCINCIKILLSAGIKEIKYIDDYNNDELVKELCLETGIRINKF